MDHYRKLLPVAGLVGCAAVLYMSGLSLSPVHLHFDEVLFGDQARSISSTGRDISGTLLPLYFPMDAGVWFHPMGVYLPALLFTVLPVSVASLRAPTALVGIVDVLLMYFVARKLFPQRWAALLAGTLLAISPAHFIHSRMAVDYLYPTPFVLSWCLCLLTYLERRNLWMLFLATSCLGVGVYSYIAAVGLMPLFLLTTLGLLWMERCPPRSVPVAIAGFLWPLTLLALFIWTTPHALSVTLGRYGFAPRSSLDPLQRFREALTPWSISDRLNQYYSAFSPGYLFVTGGSLVIGSTRTAGVFLWPCFALFLVGLHRTVARLRPAHVLTLSGLFVPPLVASIPADSGLPSRAMAYVPFAVLVMVIGVDWMWRARASARAGRLLMFAGAAGGLMAVAYSLSRVVGQANRLSGGAMMVVAGGLLILSVGYLIRRSGRQWPIAGALLLLSLVQFQGFVDDYHGDYRARSAAWFGGNIEGAIQRMVGVIGEDGRHDEVVLLDAGIPHVMSYWGFFTAVIGRQDLRGMARAVRREEEFETTPSRDATLLLVAAGNAAFRAAAERRGLVLLDVVSEANNADPSDDPAAFAIYSKAATAGPAQ